MVYGEQLTTILFDIAAMLPGTSTTASTQAGQRVVRGGDKEGAFIEGCN